MSERWVLGHYTGSEGGGLISYATHPLPARPARGSQLHTVTCDTCHQQVGVQMMSTATRARRQAVKVAAVVLSTIGCIILITVGNSAKQDPDTFQYPAWESLAYFSAAILGLTAVCTLAFVFRNTGTKLYGVAGSTAKIGQHAHWLVRAAR